MRIYLCLLCVLAAAEVKVTRVYQINRAKVYRSQDAQTYLSCKDSGQIQILAGSYRYPEGPEDLLDSLKNPAAQLPTYCLANRKMYSLVFGADQDYDLLVTQDGTAVAQRLMSAMDPKYEMMIDWQYPISQRSPTEVKQSREFLQKMMEALPNQPMVRMPASSICYNNPLVNFEYATGIYSIRKLILQAHGSGYKTYEDFFTKKNYSTEEVGYKEACPKYPSLAKLKQSAPEKTILLSVSLKPYVEGYSTETQKWIAQASSEGVAPTHVFYDDYLPNMYRL